MATRIRPIYDTTVRIKSFTTYPYKEGQVYFASENNQLFVDIDGHRAAQAQVSSIGVYDSAEELYQKGAKGFEGQILTAKSGNGYRLFYVDDEGQVHNLTFTAESLGDLTENITYQGGALQYAGNWLTNREYFADEFRTSVVLQGDNYYYATETHTAGTFNTDLNNGLWVKFSIQFDAVATRLLLAENATITKTLTMGTETIGAETFHGIIKSSGVTDLNNGPGFFLSNENGGVFRIGNTGAGGNFIRWDGTNLTINGTATFATSAGSATTAGTSSTTLSAGGWTTSGGQIQSGSIQIVPGANPYISIGQNTNGYNLSGIFLGMDSSVPKLSIVPSSGNNLLRWNGSALEVVGDIGGTIGSITVGNISINSSGITATDGSTTKFFLSSANGDGQFSGQVTASSGSIGAFLITTVGDELGTGYLKTSQSGVGSSSMTASAISVSSVISSGEFFTSSLKTTSVMVTRNIINFTRIASELTNNGIQIVTGAGYTPTNLLIRSPNDVILSAGSGFYVYARNDGGTTTPSSSFRVTVGTGGVSSKIIKDQINEIDYNSVDRFFNLINIKTYQNLLNNKPNISLIIEDEEEKNVPFKDLLFIKENRLVIYNKEVPTWLEPYKNDINVITQELDENGDTNYIFSPKGLNEHSMRGVMLAGIKSNQNKILQLQSENNILKEEIQNIKNILEEIKNNG
jgi:hypothetical protein